MPHDSARPFTLAALPGESLNIRLTMRFLAIALATVGAAMASSAFAHGVVGKRFFPATIATDDPFVSDELSLPTISSIRTNASGDEPAGRETSLSGEFSKRITPDFGISIGLERQRVKPQGEPAVHGFGNTELGLKYQIYQDEKREALVSLGLDWEIGGTGSRSIGAERFSTYTPAVFFGKGFGDLPASMQMLRPLAVTGSLGVGIPSRSRTTSTAIDADTGETVTSVERNPHVLQLGLAVEYSLPYLQSFVKDIGLPEPFSRMIPLVEFSLQRPLDRVSDKRTTGSVNPGVIWSGRKMQVGFEAVIPVNRQSGHGVGWQAQLHFFLDDIFPRGIGRPLIASGR
jgi:hypothetical protein